MQESKSILKKSVHFYTLFTYTLLGEINLIEKGKYCMISYMKKRRVALRHVRDDALFWKTNTNMVILGNVLETDQNNSTYCTKPFCGYTWNTSCSSSCHPLLKKEKDTIDLKIDQGLMPKMGGKGCNSVVWKSKGRKKI